MANIFKLKTKTGIGVTSENVYVVPGATTSTIIGITLANISGAGCLINIGIDRATADNVKLLKNVPLPQGSTLEFMQGNKIVLETTDTLTIQSDTHTSIDASITVLEMT